MDSHHFQQISTEYSVKITDDGSPTLFSEKFEEVSSHLGVQGQVLT